MNREQVLGMYDYLSMVEGTTRKVIEAFPDDRLDWAPRPGMRTVRELVEHIYGQGMAKALAVHRGTMTVEEYGACMTAPRAGGMGELLEWCGRTFDSMLEEISTLTDEECERTVEAFFGAFPGGVFLSITYDELWHHRGQLTVYLRLLDLAVPNIYAYDE